ncbi:MAG TPA: hypothetical protein VN915_06825 [Elusimicrobiota bacterium]|nr:hypothetical protein [Elusimicrobiota bacterium]
MKTFQDLAAVQLKASRGNWRKAVLELRGAARLVHDKAWRRQLQRAAAQILRWRLEALRSRRLKNPLPKRAAAVIRREILRHIGDGRPQRVALELAYKYARRKGLVD